MAVVASPLPGDAWKPYTHVFTGDNAWADAQDGAVTINGRSYPINPRLREALTTKKAWYDAGVVGPDAYPDLIMGQSVIHPENTGKWLAHVLDKAWDAQIDGRYDNDEKLQILAFAYGFLTHAAGDMWAHTIVNDFAEGVFPGVSEIATDPAKAAIALRHIIVEGYIGDATPGFDGNANRTNVAGEVNEDGHQQVSDDATRAITYGTPPNLYLWETFVGRGADADGKLTQPLPGQPVADRGPLIEFFYDLRNDLHEEAGTNSNVQAALDNLANVKQVWVDLANACSDPVSLACVEALVTAPIRTAAEIAGAAANAVQAALELVVDAYYRAWVDDIDYGLQHWGNIGNSFATGLFDPHARRAYQDEKCGEVGSGESDAARAACEDGIGLIGTYLDTLGESFTVKDPFLLSMLGFPDFVGYGIELIDEVSDFIDGLVDFPNPLEATIQELKDALREEIFGALSEVLGFDVELFAEVIKNPAAWMDGGVPTPVALPAPLDVFNNVGLFLAGEHARLDGMIGLPNPGPHDDHHQPNKRLDDEIEFVIARFAPLENTITTAKLLLLDGTQTNRVLSDIRGRDIATYPPGDRTNVMVTALGGGEPWLQSIDSDHAWRADGLPRFCDSGGFCPPGAQARDASLNGGNGRMPIWESCAVRPAFGALFKDWENGTSQWPDLGDGVAADPASDPGPPTSSLALQSGAFYDNGVRKFVGGDNLFSVSATDTPAGKGFPASDLEVQYRVTRPDGTETGWIKGPVGTTFSVGSGGDGLYRIETQAGDPCHTLAAGDGLDPEVARTFEYWLDTTPPRCTCDNPPFGSTYDSDDFATVDYELDDGVDGSGVKTFGSTIDGYLTAAGTAPISDGGLIDMFLYYPDTRTVSVTATDNIGNTGTTPCTFVIDPTTPSLSSNLERARASGLIPDRNVYRGLRDKLDVALKKHASGQHMVEWLALGAFIDQNEGQRGKGIDLVTADRFIAYALDIIEDGR